MRITHDIDSPITTCNIQILNNMVIKQGVIIMPKRNHSSLQIRKAAVLSTYKSLVNKKKIKEGGAAENRYNELLSRDSSQWRD